MTENKRERTRKMVSTLEIFRKNIYFINKFILNSMTSPHTHTTHTHTLLIIYFFSRCDQLFIIREHYTNGGEENRRIKFKLCRRRRINAPKKIPLTHDGKISRAILITKINQTGSNDRLPSIWSIFNSKATTSLSLSFSSLTHSIKKSTSILCDIFILYGA